MSNFPSAPPSEDDSEYKNICEKHKHLIETLPKGKGWREKHLYNYNGFWLNQTVIKSNLLLHVYFKPQPTDIFLASFMKSGNTWLKALMFSTLNRHGYTFSDHYLHNHNPQSAFPFLEALSYPVSDSSTPRLFATHWARALLPDRMSCAKFVYVCRDPKDVLISMWLFMNKLRSKDLPPLSLEDAFELFCLGMSEFGPFWEHVLSYWRASLESPDKILFVKYEEIKKQPEAVVRKLAYFMGKPVTAVEEEKGVVGEIVKLCSFENLSKLDVNRSGVQKFGKEVEVANRDFFRKGEIGDWKNYLSAEMKDRIDRITCDKFQGSGLILT